MSAIADAAKVTLLIADYAMMGADAKLNAIGGGWQVVGPVLTPEGPRLPGLSVACIIEVPQSHAGEQVALTLTFRDGSGDPVLAPAPEGAEPQPVRIGQLTVVQKPTVPGQFIPDEVPSRVAMAATLPPGLPVTLGTSYSWTLDIDGDSKPEWAATFYVVQPSPGVVIG